MKIVTTIQVNCDGYWFAKNQSRSKHSFDPVSSNIRIFMHIYTTERFDSRDNSEGLALILISSY